METIKIWHEYDIQHMPNPEREIIIWYGNTFDFAKINEEDWCAGWYSHIKEWAYVEDLRRASKGLEVALFWLDDAAMDTENEETLSPAILYNHVKISARRALKRIKDILYQPLTV